MLLTTINAGEEEEEEDNETICRRFQCFSPQHLDEEEKEEKSRMKQKGRGRFQCFFLPYKQIKMKKPT